jgi:16S rRNA (guanine527-N7)-methyltransferase
MSGEGLWQDFLNKALELGVVLNSEQLNQLEVFCTRVQDYSRHTNIVGSSKIECLLYDHVLDSLSLVPILRTSSLLDSTSSIPLVDVGSGAGFPALVLAIAVPELHVTLIEASGKKSRFLREASQGLCLTNRVTVCTTRAEELGHDRGYRERYRIATARAVGTFDLCAELVMPFLAINGVFLAQKSKAQEEAELAMAELCLPTLGGRIQVVHSLTNKILGKEKIVFQAQKVSSTPNLYPRTWVKIKNAPLGESPYQLK